MKAYELMIQELLQGREIEAREYKHIVNISIDSEGQNKKEQLLIGASDVLITNIEILGHANNGDLYDSLGRTKDLFTLLMKNTASGNFYSDSGVSVSFFEPGQNNVTPYIIKNGSRLDLEIKHERKVSDTVFLKQGIEVQDGQGNPVQGQIGGGAPKGYGANQTAFPVSFQIVFSGIKLRPLQGGSNRCQL